MKLTAWEKPLVLRKRGWWEAPRCSCCILQSTLASVTARLQGTGVYSWKSKKVGFTVRIKVYSLDPKYSKDRQAWGACPDISFSPFIFVASLLFSALCSPASLVIPTHMVLSGPEWWYSSSSPSWWVTPKQLTLSPCPWSQSFSEEI